jgi:hypothetical protein
LYLTQHISIFNIDEYIVGSFLESINHSHQFHIVSLLTFLDDLVINLEDFLFFRGAFAADEVHNLEGDDA